MLKLENRLKYDRKKVRGMWKAMVSKTIKGLPIWGGIIGILVKQAGEANGEIATLRAHDGQKNDSGVRRARENY